MRRYGLWSAAVVAVAGAIWWMLAVWRSVHRTDLSTYWAFVIALAVAISMLYGWTRAALSRQGTGTSTQELGELADVLANAVTEQWTRIAGEQRLMGPEPILLRWGCPSAPLAGPISAAVASQRFRPLPGLPPIGSDDLRNGQITDLHAVYGGLGSGRLVIAGGPGSGKTGTAVLLALAALAHRQKVPAENRPLVPVPVLFSMHGWDPVMQPVQDWLAERLQKVYPLPTGRRGRAKAMALMARGKIMVILDGLDEIPEAVRPLALSALNQQASFRLVVLSRTSEMAAAVAGGLLDAAVAVELQDVEPVSAAEYLTRVQLDPPSPGWRALTDRLRADPDSPVAHALSNPLTVTLVRDTCRSDDDIRQLLEFSDSPDREDAREEITDYLLDRVLPAAYAERPGEAQPRYDLQAAKNLLQKIAYQMNQDATRDLQWWRIPLWVPAYPRVLASLMAGMILGLVAGLVAGPTIGLLIGPIGGLVAAIQSLDCGEPQRLAVLHWKWSHRPVFVPQVLPYVLALLLLAGAVAGLLRGLVFGVMVGAVVGVVAAPALGLLFALRQPGADGRSPLSPLASWRSDRAHWLVYSIGSGLACGVAAGVAADTASRLPNLGITITSNLVSGFIISSLVICTLFGMLLSATWCASLAFVQLAIRWNAPIRLMTFLEDARERKVMRMIGPVYQFRHARLQDHLAVIAHAQGNLPTPITLPEQRVDQAPQGEGLTARHQ
jgi:hypothetical protein